MLSIVENPQISESMGINQFSQLGSFFFFPFFLRDPVNGANKGLRFLAAYRKILDKMHVFKYNESIPGAAATVQHLI